MIELLNNHFISGAMSVVCALWLDRMLGEPKRFHPLVGFGNLARFIEKHVLEQLGGQKPLSNILNLVLGGLAWFVAVLPIVSVVALLIEFISDISLVTVFLVNTFILYLTIGGRSLVEHTERIYHPLISGDIEQARYAVSMIVSRNTEKMNETQITSSAVESVLENGNDAVFGALFWFVIFGAPGAVLFRLANTLDAMWGYKNDKYLYFGRLSAKLDDLLGWIPARVTAFVYAIQGDFKQGLHCWKHQSQDCSSPNGGVVMTAGAGALNVTIGGPTYYHGVLHDKKPMGVGEKAQPEAIIRANKFVTNGSFFLSYLWLLFVLVTVLGGSY